MDDFLNEHQRDAVAKMKTGCILNGDVGSGKTRTALYYYFTQNGGSIIGNDIESMVNPKDLYIITTAAVRDKCEWQKELANFCISTHPEASEYSNSVIVDSWNNIKKYTKVTNAFFIFDEDRVTGYGAWTKAFLEISKSNDWIILSATPGDKWEDYMPVFIANGFYKNKTDFENQHMCYRMIKMGTRFIPQVSSYMNTGKLIRLRKEILIMLRDNRKTIPHHEYVYSEYNKEEYRTLTKERWNKFEDRPVRNASELCFLWRKIVNSDPSRIELCTELIIRHQRAIIFYTCDYELGILQNLCEENDIPYSEWNGHKHEPIVDGNKWAYLVQYNSGAEGWNSIATNCVIFYSQNYSYKMTKQAAGRIDRLNTPYVDLYYYHLLSHSPIDNAIRQALSQKKNFNESAYAYGKY